MEVGAVQGQQEFRVCRQSGNQDRPVLRLFEGEGFVEGDDIGNELNSRFNVFVPCTQPLRAKSREIAKRFVPAVARGDQAPAMRGRAFADMA